MITSRLKTIFVFSIPLFVVHGIEEYLTGFYKLDGWDEWIFGLLPFASIHQAMFATFQFMLWLLLIVAFILLLGERWRFYMLALVGVIYVFELHHIIKALIALDYYPGLLTALVFPIAAILFWKEWFGNMQRALQK